MKLNIKFLSFMLLAVFGIGGYTCASEKRPYSDPLTVEKILQMQRKAKLAVISTEELFAGTKIPSDSYIELMQMYSQGADSVRKMHQSIDYLLPYFGKRSNYTKLAFAAAAKIAFDHLKKNGSSVENILETLINHKREVGHLTTEFAKFMMILKGVQILKNELAQ